MKKKNSLPIKSPKANKENSKDGHKYTKFNPDILDEHPHLKKYIKDHRDEYKFMCLACEKKKNPGAYGFYDHLIVHLETEKHKLAVEDDPKEIDEAIMAIQCFRKKKKKVVKVDNSKIEEARVDLTLFILKHELPFSLSSSLTDLMRNQIIKYGEDVVKQVTLSDKTAATIARETLCKSVKEELFHDLEENLFSLSFDGGSDDFGPSYLCTHVRYIKEGQYFNRMLSLNEIGNSYTGEALFNIFMNVFEGSKEELLKKNLVGVCTDEGSNMSGTEKGLSVVCRLMPNGFPIWHIYTVSPLF